MIKTIKENTSYELVEKKSKFIAQIFYVQSEDEAINIIKNIKKKYYDAKHNCFAYSIMTKNGIISRMSDDGEPSGTAGAPMLNILLKKDLSNVLLIVTRYFGGILLGTGGLVKAYSDVCLNALNKTTFINEDFGYESKLYIDYSDFENFNYYCHKNMINILKTEYIDKISCIVELTNEEKDILLNSKEELNFKIYNFEVLKEKIIKKY